MRRLADGEDYALKHIDLQVCNAPASGWHNASQQCEAGCCTVWCSCRELTALARLQAMDPAEHADLVNEIRCGRGHKWLRAHNPFTPEAVSMLRVCAAHNVPCEAALPAAAMAHSTILPNINATARVIQADGGGRPSQPAHLP